MSELSEITLTDPEGSPSRLGELVERPTLVVLPRYYGCLPCRDYLRTVDRRLGEIEAAGGAALAVAPAADYQARWLIDKYSIGFPLMIDPDRKLFEALALKRKLSVALNPRGYATYAKAIARGNRQGVPTDPLQAPGLAILGRDCEVLRMHRGKALGDYPPIETALGWLAEAAGAADAAGSPTAG